MLKVALIDDEKIVLRGMAEIIEWEKEGMELVGTAMDGNSGLELICRYRPDIVFTDIRMPGINGLEMIERMKEECPDTVYIIMSGFNEFKYVQKAIGLGVIDYLEKPVTVEKYEEVLKKARELSSYRKNYSRLTENYKRMERKNIEKILNKLFSAGKTQIEGWMKELKENARELYYAKAVCVVILASENEKELSLEYYRSVIEIIIRIMKESDSVEIFSEMEQDQLIFTFFKCGSYEQDFGEKLREVKRQFNEKGFYFYIGMSRCYSSAEKLRTCYEEAKAALEYCLYRDIGQVVSIEEVEYTHHIPEHLLEGQRSVEFNIRIGNESQAIEQMTAYLDYLKEIQLEPEIFRHECLDLIYLTVKLVQENGENYPFEASRMPHNEIEKQHSVEAMTDWTIAQVKKMLDWMHQAISGNRRNTIFQVKKYIEEHYAESISLELLSEYAKMSPTSLSMNFKREVGITYVKYLSDIRMRHAVEFLREGLKAKDVCEKVGYYDYKYFSNQFKKYTGMSPDQYKRHLGENIPQDLKSVPMLEKPCS